MGVRARTAAVAGATGLVGRHLVEALLADDAYGRVVVLARRAPERSHPKLDVRVVDFERIGEQARGLGASDVFCALGTTIRKAGSEDAFHRVDFTYVHELAKAVQGEARLFSLVSALGASPTSRVFYNRTKGEIEEAVRSLGFPATHILRPSFLAGERDERRLGERVGMAAARAVSVIPLTSLRRVRPIEARVVAGVMVHLAKQETGGTIVLESERIQALGDGLALRSE